MTEYHTLSHETFGIDISPLVPDRYAAYRPLIVEALLFFLQHLHPTRAAAILAEQETLPHDVSMPQRLAALMCHCPTLHKLGQVVARDRRLGRDLRTRLQALESMDPTLSTAAMAPAIRQELKDVPIASMQLEPNALAEASVAVVIPFSLQPAPKGTPREGVLKVLKPGVEECLAEELAIWSDLSVFIDERCEHHGIPALHYAETLETIRELLANEIRLDKEQQHLAEAAIFYTNMESVQIPELMPYCSPRVTAMERIRGTKVTETDKLDDTIRRNLARTIIEALIARPVWAPSTDSLFHADPHAGNLIYTDDGRLAILDWSLVGRLGKAERVQTMQIMLGALTCDAPRIARAISTLALSPPNEDTLRQVVGQAVARVYEGQFPGFGWFLNLMDSAMLSAGVRFGEHLLLFRKSVLTIEGVIADISLEHSLDKVLPASAIRQFSREWPNRLVSPPVSRHFGTHISNLDLLSLYWGIPSAATKFWKHYWEKRLFPSSE